MLIKIAWKNIWRNPLRSWVIITSVLLGLWASTYLLAFSHGMNRQRISYQLNNSIGHLKISHPQFDQEKPPQFFIDGSKKILKDLRKNPNIQGITSRINVYGVANGLSEGFGVDIYGINPSDEKEVFTLFQNIVKGTYFGEVSNSPIVIGKKLVERLNLKLYGDVALTFQDIKGSIQTKTFQIIGIYQVPNSTFEGSHVFVKKADLSQLLGTKPRIAHQIICRMKDYHQAEKVARRFQKKFKSIRVQSWDMISPELAFIDEVILYSFTIFMFIILIALSLGIINIMSMVVLERSQELGMLMAIGVNKIKIFQMIMLETFFLTCTGLPIGLCFAWLSISLSTYYGIDLSVIGGGFESIGYNDLIYPSIDLIEYLSIGSMVFIAAIISAIFPAFKAISLKPMKTIKKA